jgi:hypothetical protein
VASGAEFSVCPASPALLAVSMVVSGGFQIHNEMNVKNKNNSMMKESNQLIG